MPDVKVTVQDITIPATPVPLPGSLVKLYDANYVVVAQGNTDVLGEIVFLSVAVANYYVRTKPNLSGYTVVAGATKTLSVTSGSSPEVLISVVGPTVPQSGDTAYCRCWGYFTKICGVPAEGLTLNFQRDDTPVAIIDGAGNSVGVIGGGSYSLTLDAAGYGELDLPSNTELSVTIPGLHDVPTRFTVPDLRTSNLVDVIFPYPRDIKFYSSGVEVTTVNVASGSTADLDVVVTARSGWVMEDIGSYLSFSSSDETIAIISFTDTVLTVTGVSAGTCDVVCTVESEQFLVPAPVITITLDIGVT